MSTDEDYMQLALQLAKSARGATSPNPLVGAVVVKDHEVVGLGAHLKAGEAHAEVHALNMAGTKARGASLFVTLEPCSHQGRTPPCTDQVIASGIKRCVVATTDPNPSVPGRGIEKLKQAGIKVEVGLCQAEADELNEWFYYYMQHRLPFVTLKTATTLDGKIATASGESKWITGEEARRDVHQLRHEQDAILVGVNTVLTDDPLLTTRLENGPGAHPIRVVLDSTLRTPLNSRVLDTSIAPTWIFTTQRVTQERLKLYQAKGAHVFQTVDQHRLSISKVLKMLGEHHVATLLVEGGGEVNASFLEGRWVQKIVAYLAPKLIGGDEAPGTFRGQGFDRLQDVPELQRVRYMPVGNDLKIVGYVQA